jgi:hypothetical protein
VYFTELPQDVQERFHWAKPHMPSEPFYGRWVAGAEDPAVLAKIIAVATVIIAGVGLLIRYPFSTATNNNRSGSAKPPTAKQKS